jgi:hypothetical protein
MPSFDRGQLAANLRGGHHSLDAGFPERGPARSGGSLKQKRFPLILLTNFLFPNAAGTAKAC